MPHTWPHSRPRTNHSRLGILFSFVFSLSSSCICPAHRHSPQEWVFSVLSVFIRRDPPLLAALSAAGDVPTQQLKVTTNLQQALV